MIPKKPSVNFREIENQLLSMSPNAEQRQKVLEMIQALKFVRKHGPLPEA